MHYGRCLFVKARSIEKRNAVLLLSLSQCYPACMAAKAEATWPETMQELSVTARCSLVVSTGTAVTACRLQTPKSS